MSAYGLRILSATLLGSGGASLDVSRAVQSKLRPYPPPAGLISHVNGHNVLEVPAAAAAGQSVASWLGIGPESGAAFVAEARPLLRVLFAADPDFVESSLSPSGGGTPCGGVSSDVERLPGMQPPVRYCKLDVIGHPVTVPDMVEAIAVKTKGGLAAALKCDTVYAPPDGKDTVKFVTANPSAITAANASVAAAVTPAAALAAAVAAATAAAAAGGPGPGPAPSAPPATPSPNAPAPGTASTAPSAVASGAAAPVVSAAAEFYLGRNEPKAETDYWVQAWLLGHGGTDTRGSVYLNGRKLGVWSSGRAGGVDAACAATSPVDYNNPDEGPVPTIEWVVPFSHYFAAGPKAAGGSAAGSGSGDVKGGAVGDSLKFVAEGGANGCLIGRVCLVARKANALLSALRPIEALQALDESAAKAHAEFKADAAAAQQARADYERMLAAQRQMMSAPQIVAYVYAASGWDEKAAAAAAAAAAGMAPPAYGAYGAFVPPAMGPVIVMAGGGGGAAVGGAAAPPPACDAPPAFDAPPPVGGGVGAAPAPAPAPAAVPSAAVNDGDNATAAVVPGMVSVVVAAGDASASPAYPPA
jgi:hypothetical protein